MTEQIQDPFKRLFKYAGDYALIFGGYIAFFFVLEFAFPKNALVTTLNNVGFLATPYVCYKLAAFYRDRAWGGFIRFGQVWSFGILLFFFSALLMSVLYYVRFQYLQPDALNQAYSELVQTMQQIPNYPQEYLDAITTFGAPTAIQIVLVYIWIHIIGGGLLFLILSPIVARKPTGLPPTDNHYKPYQDLKDSDQEPKA
jgi:hypothetical protein